MPAPDRALYFRVPIDVSVSRLLSGRAKIKEYEAGMDLRLAADPVGSFKIFQGRILEEYGHIVTEYGLTEIDATQSIGEQQHLVREYLDDALADYSPPDQLRHGMELHELEQHQQSRRDARARQQEDVA